MKETLWFGTAYYPEYLPGRPIGEDMRLMREAGINLIRVAESTWSTWEHREGEFDFSLLLRTLDAAQDWGLSVIVGTPTYAIPPWLARKYPDVLADTHAGPCRYGPRQNFDITHPGYLFHAERIIRRLMEAAAPYGCVAGFQLDNETKSYDTCSPRAQRMFRAWLEERFGTVEALNEAMGLAYWSNSLGCWDDLPDVRGTINASLGAEYQAFQRHLVAEFLLWQRRIVDEYRRPDQFVTHNFDFEWRGESFGLQPEVDQFQAARAVTVAGCDIYHKSGDQLTGAEAAFCGAVARGLKRGNYLVLETQAQGNLGWLPYPGQLRLQAFGHLAEGADCVEYWHWHSIHNAVESYWKGVLSHDMAPGAVYREAASIGRDLQRLSPRLLHLRKENRVAVMVSSRSQAGLRWFPACRPGETPERGYSDYLRWLCDSLYRLNVEYDIISDGERDFSRYSVLILPCLYAAGDGLLSAAAAYVEGGGNLLAAFRSGFADEHLRIRRDGQPHGLSDCLGVRYDRFTQPRQVELDAPAFPFPGGVRALDWMELLEPEGAQPLLTYRHPAWGGIPAATINRYGNGQAAYLGCYFEPDGLDALLRHLLPRFGIAVPAFSFPVVRRGGINQYGRKVDYYFNYSHTPQRLASPGRASSLLDGAELAQGEEFHLPPWGAVILEYGVPGGGTGLSSK